MSQITTKSLKGLMSHPSTKEKFENMLGERTQGFFVSISNAVNGNALLQKADPNSIIMAAAVAASLDLPIDPSLGFAYIVPYGNQATFQLGYRGYIQLAQRSGQFKTINVTDVREGEMAGRDHLTGEIAFTWLPDDERITAPIVGYIAFFRLLNGFEKSFYMSKEEAHRHAVTYSQTFKKGFGKWKDDFDAMAKKTVIKLLLSKYAPLSIQMQRAVISDQSLIKNFDGDSVDVDYVDNAPLSIEEQIEQKQIERLIAHIENAKDVEELEQVYEHIMDANLGDRYATKKDELNAKK